MPVSVVQGFLLRSTVLVDGWMVANNCKLHNLVPVQGQQTLGLYQCPRIRCHHFWASWLHSSMGNPPDWLSSYSSNSIAMNRQHYSQVLDKTHCWTLGTPSQSSGLFVRTPADALGHQYESSLHQRQKEHNRRLPFSSLPTRWFLTVSLHLSCTAVPSAQKLPSSSPKCWAALAGLHFTVDRVSEHSYSEGGARTDASRVSWYRDNFCKCHKIVDPYLWDVNNYQEANLLFACYAVFLALDHTLLC